MGPRRGSLFDVVLSAMLFYTPASVEAATTNVDVEVPFVFDHGSVIVKVMVSGQGPFDMLLDTGVDPSVIDLATAKSIGLRVATHGAPGSGGGHEANPAYETGMPQVEIGPLRVKRVAALATDLSRIGTALGRPIVGVLGYSLLKDRIVQFDYPHRVVRFLRTAPSHASRSGRGARTIVSFRHPGEILIDDVAIDGKRVVANLDTGSNASFQMAPAAIVALGLEQEAAAGDAESSVGFNGTTHNRKGTVDRLRIGNLKIERAPMTFLGSHDGHDDEQWSVRIGNAFLEAYVVTIDYRHHRITFEAAP